MKTDVDTCIREIADWYIQNRREITEPELEAILRKHCETEKEVRKFIIFLGTESGKMRFKTLLREMKESEPQPYLEKYRKLVEKYPDRIDKHLERAKDEKASLVLGRGFGESFDDYLERNPSVKRRWDELTTAIGEMEQLKAGIIGTIKPQATKGSKEPWQMTLEQFALEKGARPAWVKAGYGETYRTHKRAVERAISEGKPVPPEVLADYPELVKPRTGGNPYEIPKTRVASLGFIELELPVAMAVEALVNENPWSSGFHGALNQRWTIVFRGKVSNKAVKAAEAAGLEVAYREAPKRSGQILTDVSLPDVGVTEIEKATEVFNRFAELYKKGSYERFRGKIWLYS